VNAPAQMPAAPPASSPARPRWRAAAVFPTPFTAGIAGIPHLAALLGAERVLVRPLAGRAGEVDAVVGWGEKRNTRRGRAWARRHQVPYWRAEDGFLRSVGLGVAGEPPLSIVLDDLGIYYDARSESRLERMLAATGAGDPLADPALIERATAAMARIAAAGLSKYNDAPPGPVDLGERRSRVLVVDQTAGDLSIACGLADAGSFQAMLRAALDDNPDAEVVVKTHPDVLAGAKRGYLEAAAGDRVRLWARPATPAALLGEVDRVYVVSSQLGFEGLLAGLPVTCFGAPWYAGWGLTDDRVVLPRRGRSRSLAQLFAAAYLLYARYVDPDSGVACEIERVIEHLELQRAMFERNRGTIFCFGFRPWKHNYVRAYLRCPGNRVVFARSAADAERRGFDRTCRALVWGQRESDDVRALAERRGVALERMEDGFLRSVGLGSDLVTPASLVVDRRGIYYDPSRPSELEELLEAGGFTAAELDRARALRRRIVDTRLSKYNVGRERALAVPAGRRVVLVPGQVEDDASIRLGCRDIRTNLALLEAARGDAPDAFIVFKPHPDVLSGNRNGGVDRAAALRLADHIEEDATLAQCLDVADEVHTMTSLVGFEALLRGLRVVVHGQPFYAGWGLTDDRNPPPRRTRRLSLDELCAGTLLRYPRYVDRQTGRFTTPEATIDQLIAERDGSAGARALKLSWPRRQLRKLVHVYRGVTHAP